MAIAKENIRLTLGLKIKQLRLDKGLSLSELAQRSGISISYLNEIEKGKKYPQSEKILQLAEALEVSYDWLVSLKLHQKLAPIAELLRSNILQELPLDMLGIDPAQLIEMLSNAPTKLSAFISTLLEISRNYDMQVEQFYFSVLRSYQELHDNYFEDLEEEVARFRQEMQIEEQGLAVERLAKLLQEQYQYRIQEHDFEGELSNLRYVLLPDKTLLLNKRLDLQQKNFALARELGFQYLKIQKRTYTFSWVEVSSFDQVLNNFKASYFAGALLIDQASLVKELTHFFEKETWDSNFLPGLLYRYKVTPEMLMHRISNLLPRYFQMHQLFFLRFDDAQQNFNLTKEMHLAGLHNPHATALGEHYCRKWVSLTVFSKLKATGQHLICDAQISQYYDSPNEYFVFTLARPMLPTPHLNSSISIGILLNESTRRKIKFLESLAIRKVGSTCERCSAPDCEVRKAAAQVLEARRKNQRRKEKLAALMQVPEQ
jgi:transcriptional regulator with XRE-family HTH domain